MYPEIPLPGGSALSTYFLVISLAVTVCVLWFIRRAESKNLARVTAIDLALAVLVGGFIGARALHIIYEDWDIYAADPLAVFKVWNGGFVYLGGLVGAMIATVLVCRFKQEPFWFWADIATPPIALGYTFGRVACFLNGCCYGKISAVPWAIMISGGPRHPTQLYASLWDGILTLLLLKFEPKVKTSGVLFNSWLAGHCVGRIIMELFRADPRGSLVLGYSLGTAMSVILLSFALTNLVAAWLHR